MANRYTIPDRLDPRAYGLDARPRRPDPARTAWTLRAYRALSPTAPRRASGGAA